MTWLLILLGCAVIVLIFALYTVNQHRLELEQRLKTINDEFVLELELERKKALEDAAEILKKKEADIRKDAARRSQAVVRGRIVEQIAPFIEGFEYNPQDCRFLGSPIDFVVFDGLSARDVKAVIFVEVKSGNSRLSVKERQVRDVISEGKVRFETFRSNKAN